MNTVTVWSSDGSKKEQQTAANARDLVMHAGWHYEDPRKALVEDTPADTAEDSGKSFDDAEAEAAKAAEEAEKKAAAEKAEAEAAKAAEEAEKKAAAEKAEAEAAKAAASKKAAKPTK